MESHSSVDRYEKHSRTRKQELSVIWTANDRFREALDNWTYLLANKPSSYDDRVAQNVAKLAERLQTQIESYMLDSLDPTFVIRFLSAFKLACGKRSVEERVELWLLHIFMRCPTASALNARIELRSKWHSRQKEGTVMKYCETVNFLVETYATVDIFGETRRYYAFTELSNKPPTEYAGAMWNKALKCD